MIALKKLLVSALILFMIIPANIVLADKDYSESDVERTIVTALENFEDEVDISEYAVPKDDVSDIITGIIEKNAQLFYVNREYQVRYTGNTNLTCSIGFSFKYSDSELRIKVNDFNSRIQLIVDEINKSESDFDKVHFCHDYMVKNYSYDQTKGSTDAYNMLLTGEGTCMAYTGLFGYVMKQCGVECTVVKSEQLNHIWNAVKLNGEYYNVDVTWDDPIGGVSFSTSHKYLLKSDYYFDLHKHEGRESDVNCTSTLYDSYKWSDGEFFAQAEDVNDIFEYIVTTVPIVFVIFIISIAAVIISVIVSAILKRKRRNKYPYY